MANITESHSCQFHFTLNLGPMKPINLYFIRLTSSDVNWSCLRKDNINLIEDFQNKTKDPEFAGKKVKVVENRGQLNSVKPEEVDYLMGKV